MAWSSSVCESNRNRICYDFVDLSSVRICRRFDRLSSCETLSSVILGHHVIYFHKTKNCPSGARSLFKIFHSEFNHLTALTLKDTKGDIADILKGKENLGHFCYLFCLILA